MGSSGSGNFSDYPGNQSQSNRKNGGSSGEDRCNRAFSTRIEDVPRCAYFRKHGQVPLTGSIVSIIFNGVRISVVDAVGDEIGFLPTTFNYLILCMENGITYGGSVTRSANNAVPVVEVDIAPLS